MLANQLAKSSTFLLAISLETQLQKKHQENKNKPSGKSRMGLILTVKQDKLEKQAY